MTVFTEIPSAFVITRTALALAAFCFLPGYLLVLARAGAKRFGEVFLAAPAEALLQSVVVSLLLLAFAVMLLMFSTGFSAIALFALESAFLAGAWFYWRKQRQ